MILKDRFESSSSSAKYDAQYDTVTGKGTCNCPGWTKRAVRECKHTKDLAKRCDPCAKHYGDAGVCDEGKPAASPHRELQSDDPFQGFREPPAFKPMLASAMKEGQSLEDFHSDEWVMEEKYDGHRLLVVVQGDSVTAWTRPGHERPAAERSLPDHLVTLAKQLPDGVYDGELLVPGGTSSDVVRLDLQHALNLVLFDVLEIKGIKAVQLPLSDRRALLVEAVERLSSHAIRIPEWAEVSSTYVLLIWERGGEGVIIKRKSSTYKSGWRTPDWVKVKEIGAAQFTIIGFDEGKNGPCSIFKLRHDDGRETSCKVLTNELLALVHKQPKKYIGRRIVVSHMGFTKSGLWRHPVFDHFVVEG